MIIVVGTIEVAEGDRDRFLDSRREQATTSLAEAGCLDYSFAADAGDPCRVRLLERWEQMGDLEAHLAGLRSSGSPSVGSGSEPAVPSRYVDMVVYDATPVKPPWA
jgi:quinol monooxygenase YgiN